MCNVAEFVYLLGYRTHVVGINVSFEINVRIEVQVGVLVDDHDMWIAVHTTFGPWWKAFHGRITVDQRVS